MVLNLRIVDLALELLFNESSPINKTRLKVVFVQTQYFIFSYTMIFNP